MKEVDKSFGLYQLLLDIVFAVGLKKLSWIKEAASLLISVGAEERDVANFIFAAKDLTESEDWSEKQSIRVIELEHNQRRIFKSVYGEEPTNAGTLLWMQNACFDHHNNKKEPEMDEMHCLENVLRLFKAEASRADEKRYDHIFAAFAEGEELYD